MEQLVTFVIPGLTLACGEMLNLKLDTIAMLKSAGCSTLVIETCYKCRARHELVLQDLDKIVMTVVPKSGVLINPNISRN